MEKILDKFGIEGRCESMAEHYAAAVGYFGERGADIMDFEKYPIFTHRKEDIRRIRDELAKDSDNVIYAYLLYSAIEKDDGEAMKILCSPRKAEKSEFYDTLPLFSLLYQLPVTVEEHKRRGLPEDVTEATLEMFQNQIGDHVLLHKRIGIATYFFWMLHFVKCEIIRVGRFNLQICKYNGTFELFSDGEEYRIIPTGGTYHRSGRALGSIGFEDEEGSFTAQMREEDGCVVGLTVKDGLVLQKEERLDLSKWKRIVASGDTVVSVHIPSGGPMTPEIVDADLKRGQEIICKGFGDFASFYCCSWLLDVDIKKITGKEGNVTRFGDKFLRYPTKSSGGAVFEYVFNHPGAVPAEELVPTNSFSAAIKEHLLRGGHVYGAAGFIPKY